MTIEQEIQSLNKIINSGLILSVYPNVDHIDVSFDGTHHPYLIYKMYLKDKDATNNDLYNDVDPFYLVDYHVMNIISKLIPFEHLPIKDDGYQLIVYNGSGIPIFDWEHELSVMNRGSLGRSDWERRSKNR
jgi:hypothetical protein